jgi:O-antigen/teichoic acid export membrane protein
VSGDSTPRPSLHLGDTISRNAVFAMATQLATAAFTAVLTIYLVRALGPSVFGTFALAIGITGLVNRPSDLGTTQSAARFVAEHHGDRKGILGVLGMALRTRLVTGTAIAVALFFLAAPIADLYGTPELTWPLRGAAISLFGQSIFRLATAVFVALRRTSSSFVLTLSESAMEFTATIVLVALGAGATGAAFGRAAGYVFGAALGFIALARFLDHSPLLGTGSSPVSRREFVAYAGALLIVVGVFTAYTQIDLLLLGAYLGTHAVGIFAAPLRLIAFLGYPGLALSQALAPRLARHPDRRSEVPKLIRGLKYIVIVQAALLAFVTTWAAPISEVALGSQFAASAGVLRALAPYVFLTGLGPVLVAPLNYMGEARRRIPISIATLAANVILDVILIPRIGVYGAAIGTSTAYAIYIGAHLWLGHRIIGIPIAPLAPTLARSLAAAGVTALVLVAIGTSELSPLQWIAGAVLGTGAFIGCLLVTRELSLGEFRLLASRPLDVLRASRSG